MQTFIKILSRNVKYCHYSNGFCRWVTKYPAVKPNSPQLPWPTNIMGKMTTYLETIMPFTWRNLNRSCAFSRSLNFSLAVKVSYGTKRGWLPPPGMRRINTNCPLYFWKNRATTAPSSLSPRDAVKHTYLCSLAPTSSSWPRYCDSSQPPPPPFPVPHPRDTS